MIWMNPTMDALHVYLQFFFLITSLLLYSRWRKNINTLKLEEPKAPCFPQVSGKFPLIGHLLQLRLYPESFISNCYRKYGPLFEIKLLSWKVGVICDREVIKEIWSDEGMTLSAFLDRFEMPRGLLIPHLHFVKLARAHFKPNSISPQCLGDYGDRLTAQLDGLMRKEGAVKLHLDEIFLHHAHDVFCHAALGVDVSGDSQIFQDFKNYRKYSEASVKAGFLFPMWLVSWWYEKSMFKNTPSLNTCLQRYLDASLEVDNKDDLVSRVASECHPNGRPLSIDEISKAFLKINLVGVTSISMGMLHTLLLLVENPDILAMYREEAVQLVRNKNYEGMIHSSILRSCFLEGSRLGGNYFGSSQRLPLERSQEFGGWNVGNLDMILTAGHLINGGEGAKDLFVNEQKFQPSRWINQKNQLRPLGITTFGGGRHLCPAKFISIAITNVTLAHLLARFEIDGKSTKVTPVPMMSNPYRMIKVETRVRTLEC